MSIVTPNKVNL